MNDLATHDLDRTLAALAEPTRRQVIDLLREGPRRAGELAAATNMTAPAISRHLRVLRSTGLVDVDTADGDARLRLYRLRPDRFVALQAWLDQLAAYWDTQLTAFKRHAEGSPG